MLRFGLIWVVLAGLVLASAEDCPTAGQRAALHLSYHQASGLLKAEWRAEPAPDADHTAILKYVHDFNAGDPVPTDTYPLLDLLDAIGQNFWQLTGVTPSLSDASALTFTFTEELPNRHGYRTIWAHALYSRYQDMARGATRYSMVSGGERGGSSWGGAADLYAGLFPEFEALPEAADPFLATLDMFGTLWGFQLDGHGRLETPERTIDLYVMRRSHDSTRDATTSRTLADRCPHPGPQQGVGG